jgi:hypothetical protein
VTRTACANPAAHVLFGSKECIGSSRLSLRKCWSQLIAELTLTSNCLAASRRNTALPAALFSDFNPIELVFRPLKAFLRRAAERTIDGLNRNIRSFVRTLAHPNVSSTLVMPRLGNAVASRSEQTFSRSLLLAGIEFERVNTTVINTHCCCK